MLQNLRKPIAENRMNTTFLNDVLGGLSQSPKTLPCKYFYDERGSELFEAICRTQDYYVTRTEMALLEHYAGDIAAVIGERACIIEPGSGAGEKIEFLLDALPDVTCYAPMDISEEILLRSAETIRQRRPGMAIHPILMDFTKTLDFTPYFEGYDCAKKVIFFPGSTIGNFTPEAAEAFLRSFATSLGQGGGLVIGVDLVKDRQTLERAYDDSEGVTAAFNKNLLYRINAELEADFDPDGFRHEARFNVGKSRIEMHLVSSKPQTVTIDENIFEFKAGESIHTENSYKYEVNNFQALARRAGFRPHKAWTDERNWFSLHYWEVA